MCGMLQVSDWQRFVRRRPPSHFLTDRLQETAEAYLGPHAAAHGATAELADPLLLLEQGIQTERPLPPMFAGVGTADPLLDDSRRLGRALDVGRAKPGPLLLPGEIHAFHAFVFARRRPPLLARAVPLHRPVPAAQTDRPMPGYKRRRTVPGPTQLAQ